MAEDKRKDDAAEKRPEPEEARRKALARMGRFAAYTAPVMLGLLGATKARAYFCASRMPSSRSSHSSRIAPTSWPVRISSRTRVSRSCFGAGRLFCGGRRAGG